MKEGTIVKLSEDAPFEDTDEKFRVIDYDWNKDHDKVKVESLDGEWRSRYYSWTYFDVIERPD